jgi:hypothetical protein
VCTQVLKKQSCIPCCSGTLLRMMTGTTCRSAAEQQLHLQDITAAGGMRQRTTAAGTGGAAALAAGVT